MTLKRLARILATIISSVIIMHSALLLMSSNWGTITGNCKTRTAQNNGIEIESMQLGGVIGIQYEKQYLTVGDRYCIDAVGMNAENLDAYLWVEGDVADANRRFSDSEYTSSDTVFPASTSQIRYGIRTVEANIGGKVLSSHFQYQK